ncbi:MAG: TIGR00701 family protein [Arcobacter sp.]|nr:MAG: TIGR00701 family protein [Arcobacter sp.]
MAEYYFPIVAFHVISVLSWMAMLFYLPRLYVYHQEHSEKKEFVEVVKIQEFKLYKYIGLPAMWATILSGTLLIYINPELMKQGWMHAKLLLLFFLIGYSFSLETYRKQLKKDACKRSGKFFRAYNEVPTILSILIVTYVINKSIPLLFSISISLFFMFIMYMIMKNKPKKSEN